MPSPHDEAEQTQVPASPPSAGAPAPEGEHTPNPAPSEVTVAPAPAAESGATTDAGVTLEPISVDVTRVPEATVTPSAPRTVLEVPTAPVTVVASGGASGTDATLGHESAPPADGATMPALPASFAAVRAVLPRGDSPSETGTMVGRFALRDLHASGGLGEVFTARDTELNREVAVKRIKSRWADDPGSRHRFLTEAELTARLDHPGVVPVFGLVNDSRGRPCYAMRFIRGETLKDEIDRYHAAPTPGAPASAVPKTVAFRHLLARFIATCQAIAYAHSRNIIHRDIKPANIMVGTFGETLVVDWGLAKSLTDGPDPERLARAASEAGGLRHDADATEIPTHATMAGTAVGTPAYMAPEQANGDVANVGPRSDIYALGATLYVILTGVPPINGKTTGDVLEKARRADFPPAIQVNPDCPKPLDAVCRKATALRPEDRYATALELAADVERWLSDEPVSCYQYPLLARLARWARRHPARVAAGASLLLAGALAAGGIAFAVNEGRKSTQAALDKVTEAEKKTAEERDRVIEEQKRTRAALARVTEEQQKTDEQRKIALNLRDVAAARYEGAVGAYNTLVSDIDKKLKDRGGMQDVRKKLLLDATAGLNKLIAGGGGAKGAADRTLVAAHRQMGEVYQLIGDTKKAGESFAQAVAIAAEARKVALPGDARAAERDYAKALEKQATNFARAGDSRAALAKLEEAVEVFKKLAADKTDAQAQQDLAEAQKERAKVLMEQGKTSRALDDVSAAGSALAALAAAEPNDLDRARAHTDALDLRAVARLRTGNTQLALADARDALTDRQKVAQRFEDSADAVRDRAAGHGRLGDVYFQRAQMTDAVREYAEGAKLLKALADADANDESPNASVRADLVQMNARLAAARLRTGDVREAVTNATAARDVALELQKADPLSARAEREVALARERLGEALLAVGDPAGARKEFEAANAVFGALHAGDPASAAAQLELARGLERVGDTDRAAGSAAAAVSAYADSVKAREVVAAGDGASASAKRDLAQGLYKLAEAQAAANQRGRAEATAARATELFVQLAEQDPDSGQAQRDLAQAYGDWGGVLRDSGYNTGALIVWQSALSRCEVLTKRDAGNVQAREDEATAWERLAGFFSARGNTPRALEAARKAVDLWTAVAQTARTKSDRVRLARAMIKCGDITAEVREFDEARDWYKKAAKEAEGAANDPLLAPVLKRAAEQQQYASAVEAGLTNAEAVLKFPEAVHVPALRLVTTLEVRADRATAASIAAAELAKRSTLAGDQFAAARALASCAASLRPTPGAKAVYAADAVKQLRVAIVAGFKEPDALTGPEWDAVRKLAPTEFDTAAKELAKAAQSK
jgi:serine/threonine protein kinase